MKTNVLSFSAGLFALLLAPVVVVADRDRDDDDDIEIPFAEAHVFFELNNTDGDLGIHALIDGDPWKRLRIEDQNERRVLDVKVKGRLRRQGLTEIFFESAEPTFDELSPEEFFDRFPEGTYEVEGITLEGDEMESETEITHAMPAPPEPTVNGEDAATVCDDEDPLYNATEVSADDGIVIAWPAVTTTHPDLGSSGKVTIYNYQVVVETELEIDGEEFASVLSVILPPGEPGEVIEMTIPEEFIAQGDTFKYEVLAREESFNQTAIESCFLYEKL
ncbi:MAG: hypothetical protein GY783_02930 [Gammaproteobacteria bacterium]|nr:hypothetical protein [Gammaproteobacteria bacterium]